MSLGLIGRKVGMTRLFTDEGDAIPVTVIDVSNNRVAQIKTQETDGYNSVQLAHGERRASRVTKAMAGHFAKAGVLAGNALNEFRLDTAKLAELSQWAKRWTFRASPSVRGMLEQLSVITLSLVALAMEIQDPTMFQAQSVWPKIRGEFFRVSA
jgi:ribosomal protein L3